MSIGLISCGKRSSEDVQKRITLSDAINSGGIWYILSGNRVPTADSAVDYILYFNNNKLLHIDMAETGSRHILSDFAGREAEEIIESLNEERRKNLDDYEEFIEERLDYEKASLSGASSDIELNLNDIEDEQIKWDIIQYLNGISRYDDGFHDFMETYFEGDLSSFPSERLVVQRDSGKWADYINASIQADEELLNLSKKEKEEVEYRTLLNDDPKMMEITWDALIIDRSAVSEALEMLDADGDVQDISSDIVKYIQQIETDIDFISYDGNSIVIKEMIEDFPEPKGISVLTDEPMTLYVTGELEGEEAINIKGAYFYGYSCIGKTMLTQSDISDLEYVADWNLDE